MKKWIAILLSLLLTISLLTACGQQAEIAAEEPEKPAVEVPVQEELEVPTEVPEEEPTEEEPTEEDPVEEPPVSTADQAVYQEALAVLSHLNALDDAGKQDPIAVMTGAQAHQMFSTFGMVDSGFETAASVTGADFLLKTLQLLGYDPAAEGIDGSNMAGAIQPYRLLPGLQDLDVTANLTVEQAAQILRNALLRNVVDYSAGIAATTGVTLQSKMGLKYTILPDYPDGYNRVSGQWTDEATGSAITQPSVGYPVLVYGGKAMSWCEILTDLGYAAEGNNSMVTFQNTWTGEEFTVKFEKCHWDNAGNGDIHSGCSNDWTNEVNTTMEIYQVAENEYRNIFRVNFLCRITDGSMTMFGYNSEQWGPWAIEGLPENGYYITTYFWNAYGAGEGLDVIQPAETMVGTLEAITDSTITIDGSEYTLSYVFNYGSNMAKAPTAVGKQFTFYLDQHGLIVGCGEYFGAS